MKNAKRRKSKAAATEKRLPSRPVMASAITAGSICALLGSPALAIELGQIQLESALGQPLRASIPFVLAPNEQINGQCVYLRSGIPATGIANITRAAISLNGQQILLRGNTPLREPMMNLQLAIDCPYTARLSRDYVLLLNPPSLAEDSRPAANFAAEREMRNPAVRTSRPAAPIRAARVSREPAAAVVTGQSYRVRTGDTLSGIASHIENRELGLWESVDAIFAANPGAFLDGNIDRLVAGSTLIIPASLVGATATAATSKVNILPPAPKSPVKAYRRSVEGVTPVLPSGVSLSDKPVEARRKSGSTPADAGEANLRVGEAAPALSATTGTPSGDIPALFKTDVPAVTAMPVATVSIPDTGILQQAPKPVPVGDVNGDQPTQSWLAWLGGAGVVMFLGLVIFGRRLRERFDDNPDLEATQLAETTLNRRGSDRGESVMEHDIGLDDITPVTSDYALDADLTDGSGFDNDDIDVALDYNFAASGDYSDDLDLVVGENAEDDTDVPAGPAHPGDRTGTSPETAGTEYDMSMVVDVSKQNFESSATTRDLQAIQVAPLTPGNAKLGPLDLTTELDHRILEQDYEDEMSATQILNNEIELAARELQERLSEFDADTNAVSMAEDLDGTAEVTAEMPARARARNDNHDNNSDAADIGDSLTVRLPGGIDESFELDLDMETAVHDRKSKAG